MFILALRDAFCQFKAQLLRLFCGVTGQLLYTWLSSFCGVFDTIFSYSYSMVKNTWTVRNRIPVETRFFARPDRPWGPPSLLYNGCRVFPGVRGGRGVGLTPTPSSAEVLERVELYLYSP